MIDKTIDLSIDGEILDLKQAREFVSLILRKNFGFPEIRGMGQSAIRIFGDFGLPEVHAEFRKSAPCVFRQRAESRA